mmetsp:Transcript_40521/g.49143  ORF Transcript_40521/g.49143 Transcript_40521/m.49143 type:complete len:304 (-) Transcript_40521:531-1442(-)|eukprot:CAMPEP_0197843834 /NCGR_PEP_ID=MMETSP1438-20131217/784_1 /TAXON_ID=1461541 /ORGANISM="Pterosperma sp., Strain CCMP1384" /LENGTH=303 /DNA_ID=CAMNT_0043454239 /DNA_START=81 /DNA_END=992 /DNA_ORIENTATION=-
MLPPRQALVLGLVLTATPLALCTKFPVKDLKYEDNVRDTVINEVLLCGICHAVCNETINGILPPLHEMYPQKEMSAAFRSKYKSPIGDKLEAKLEEACDMKGLPTKYQVSKSVFGDMQFFWNATLHAENPNNALQKQLKEWEKANLQREEKIHNAETPEEEEIAKTQDIGPKPVLLTSEEIEAWQAEQLAQTQALYLEAQERFVNDKSGVIFTADQSEQAEEWLKSSTDHNIPWARKRIREQFKSKCILMTESDEFSDALGDNKKLTMEECLPVCKEYRMCKDDKFATLKGKKKGKKGKKAEL